MSTTSKTRCSLQLSSVVSQIKHSLFLFALSLFVASPALPCDVNGYDQYDPRSRSDTTDATDKTHFEWNTDVDPLTNDEDRSWHYIRNLHDWKLSARWDKTGLVVPLNNPLAKGYTSCSRDYGVDGSFKLDTRAPITTSNDGDKKAIAYVVDPGYISDGNLSIAGAELVSHYTSATSSRNTASATLVLHLDVSNRTLEAHVSTGSSGETMAFRPKSIGVNTNSFQSALRGSSANVVRTASLHVLLGADAFTLEGLSDINGDEFLQFSIHPLTRLSFTLSESSLADIEDTALLLLSPQGDVIVAKRLFSSLLTR